MKNNRISEIVKGYGIVVSEGDLSALGRLEELHQKVSENLVEIGKIVYGLVKKDYDYRLVIADTMGWVTDVVARFEQLGKGEIHPDLMYPRTVGEQMLSKLPMSDQEKFLEEPIPVALPGGEHRMIKVQNLTSRQRKQVFGKVSIRSLAEQVPVMDELGLVPKSIRTPSETIALSVKGSKLTISHAGVNRVLSRKEMMAFLSQMG